MVSSADVGADAVAQTSAPGFLCYLHGSLEGGELVTVCGSVWGRFFGPGRTWADRGQNVGRTWADSAHNKLTASCGLGH